MHFLISTSASDLCVTRHHYVCVQSCVVAFFCLAVFFLKQLQKLKLAVFVCHLRSGAAGPTPLSYHIAKKLVFKKVRKALGLDRCNKCYTGAAPITKDTLEFFLSLDIPLYELYGMSESTGPHTISRPEAFKLTRCVSLLASVRLVASAHQMLNLSNVALSHSCGIEIPGCKTKLHNPDEEGNGEICFWGRHVFMGYLNTPEKTEEALDAEGWLHSGDLGKHDENGFLFITGRIKGVYSGLLLELGDI